jgi:hypothetical protein
MRFRKGCIGLAVMAGALMAAGPASATGVSAGPSINSFQLITETANGIPRTMTATGHGQILVSPNLTQMNISLECTATATPNALATGIIDCYLLSPTGQKYSAVGHGALTGPADAQASAVLTVPTALYRVCVVANAFYQDNVYIKNPAPVCSN